MLEDFKFVVRTGFAAIVITMTGFTAIGSILTAIDPQPIPSVQPRTEYTKTDEDSRSIEAEYEAAEYEARRYEDTEPEEERRITIRR